MVVSACVGKLPISMFDRFFGERRWHPFAVHGTTKTANVSVYFSPNFSVAKGTSRIILFSTAIPGRTYEDRSELKRDQTIICASSVHLIHRRCAASKVQDGCGFATLQVGFLIEHPEWCVGVRAP